MSGQVPGGARATTARDLRKLRGRRLVRRMFLGVVLPTLLATIYYGVIVTPLFESVTTYTIQSADGGVGAGGLALLIAAVPSSAGRDVMIVQEYVESRDMLRILIDEEGFLEHYQRDDVDPISRLAEDATFEEQYTYYREKLSIHHDTQSGVLTLRVKAFSGAKAHQLAGAILGASERMVNELTEQARTDRTALARREMDRAEERLTTARQALVELQREGGELDPMQSAAALLEVRSRLQIELATARAELSSLSGTLQPTAPQLVDQRRRVGGLQRQLERHNAQLAGQGDAALHETIARFEPLIVEKEFAQRAYQSALTSLEVSRVEADRQHRYLVTISQPSEPDHATHPRFGYSVLTVFVLSFALLGIGTLLLASIREHANV